MVYFLLNPETKAIKIGYTTCNMKKRLSQIQTGSSSRLFVLGTIPDGTIKDEKKLHARFKRHRVSGEWFYCHFDILQYVIKNTESYYGESQYRAIKYKNGAICLKKVVQSGNVFNLEDIDCLGYFENEQEAVLAGLSFFLAMFSLPIMQEEEHKSVGNVKRLTDLIKNDMLAREF